MKSKIYTSFEDFGKAMKSNYTGSNTPDSPKRNKTKKTVKTHNM